MKHFVVPTLEWLGESLSDRALAVLGQYARWLASEGISTGGLGPREASRIEERHLADSLAFGCRLPSTAGVVLDVGSGIGLPGIPLAILREETRFVLLDRSRRRTDLASRAVRILGLENVDVVTAEIGHHEALYDGLVMRAALPPRQIVPLLGGLLKAAASATVGLTRSSEPEQNGALAAALGDAGLIAEAVEVPVLDSPTWLLNMRRRDLVN